MVALETELEMLCHRLGQLLDYVEAPGASLIDRLDNALCLVRDIVDFDVFSWGHNGAAYG